MYVILNDEPYDALEKLLLGEYKSEIMTVISGENSIRITGRVICSQIIYQSYVDDSDKLTPDMVADSIEYLPVEIDQNTYLPFTPYINGKEADGEYTIYDMSFKTIPKPLISSVINPWAIRRMLFDDAVWPGKYIVELVVIHTKGEISTYVQYFFGVILPEKPQR